ncbi:hypothetical protein KAR91_04985 [Candidatus Pacearchaeota archaeon]|nr:hypothetical protein [Candidatus Pacearchaeota archaeon]
MTEEEIEQNKNIALYSAKCNAWVNTRMERDKSLLTLSTAGIGFLITLFVNFDITECGQNILCLLAGISFFVTIISCLLIFNRNAKHIEESVQSGKDEDSVLKVLDNIVFWGFIVGLIFIILFGVTIQCNKQKLLRGDVRMSEEKKENKKDKKELLTGSLNGINKLKTNSEENNKEQQKKDNQSDQQNQNSNESSEE